MEFNMSDVETQEGEGEVETALVEELIKELVTKPAMAIEFVQTLGKITKPWEALGGDGKPVNEIPVPPGTSPRDFVKTATSGGAYISGYRLVTIFGDEVAVILKDTPKWKIMIEGEYQIDAPFVQHGQKAENNAKEFAEEKLKERGYTIG